LKNQQHLEGDQPMKAGEAIGRLLLSVLAIVVMLIPTGLFFLSWSLLNPTIFVEKLLTIVLGLMFLGSLQVWFLVLGVSFLADVVWGNDK